MLKREGDRGVLVGEFARECVRIGTNLNIDEEGNVYDCFNMEDNSYGNIGQTGLVEMWKEIKKINEGIKVHGLCSCRGCSDRDSVEREIIDCV